MYLFAIREYFFPPDQNNVWPLQEVLQTVGTSTFNSGFGVFVVH